MLKAGQNHAVLVTAVGQLVMHGPGLDFILVHRKKKKKILVSLGKVEVPHVLYGSFNSSWFTGFLAAWSSLQKQPRRSGALVIQQVSARGVSDQSQIQGLLQCSVIFGINLP